MKEYTGCNNCKYDSKESNEFPCVECSHNRVVDYYEPKTNADRIRNMNVAGLKIFIERAIFCGGLIANEKSCALCQGCKYPFCQDIEAWLQSEVKEGDSDAS